MPDKTLVIIHAIQHILVSFIKAGGLHGLTYKVAFPPAAAIAFLINGILNSIMRNIERF
jgi:hypothetical protein